MLHVRQLGPLHARVRSVSYRAPLTRSWFVDLLISKARMESLSSGCVSINLESRASGPSPPTYSKSCPGARNCRLFACAVHSSLCWNRPGTETICGGESRSPKHPDPLASGLLMPASVMVEVDWSHYGYCQQQGQMLLNPS